MEQLRLGDVVQLKSGGPLMTISDAGSQGYWICSWFDGKVNKTAGFKAEALKKAAD